jgi:hypothetical protein
VGHAREPEHGERAKPEDLRADGDLADAAPLVVAEIEEAPMR